MPELRPFRALRYSPQAGNLADLVAPPYDVIDEAQYRELCARSPHNAVRLILDKGYSPDVLPPPEWYGQAARLLAAWRAQGVLERDAEPAFYLYAQSFTHQGRRLRRKLLLGALRLEPYGAGKVFPHENTTPGPKTSRLNLLRACRTNLSPILGFFPDAGGRINAALDELSASEPAAAFTDQHGIGHELRPILGHSEQQALAEALKPLPLYIADGHHRYETALAYREAERALSLSLSGRGRGEGPGQQTGSHPPPTPSLAGRGVEGELPLDFVLAACMSGADPGLVICPTHRVVAWEGDCTAAGLVAKAEEWFAVRRLGGVPLGEALALLESRPSESFFIIYAGSAVGYAGLELRNEAALGDAPFGPQSPLRRLPAAVFTHGFLGRLPALRGARVSYTPSPEAAVQQAAERARALAGLLPGVRPDELMAVVNAEERMPAKSTYFWPKPLTGLALRPLDAW